MKELLKRLLCVLMALAMVACLAACGATEEDDDEGSGRKSKKETTEEVAGDDTKDVTEEVTEKEEETLVGEWEAEIDLSDYMSDMLYSEMGLELDVEDYAIVMTIEFKENGTYKADMDASKAATAMEDIMDDLWPMLIEMYAEQLGMSEKEVEDALVAEGVTKDALMEEMDIEGAVSEAFEDFTKGEWVLDGDELYMATEDPEDTDPVEIEFDGDEFSIVGGEFTGDSDMDEYIMPIVFERV